MPKKKKFKVNPPVKKKVPANDKVKVNGLFSFKAEDGKTYNLTMKQKLFGEFYLELNGNGTDAIIEAGYDVSYSRGGINRKLAGKMAYENLKKPEIYYYINTLLTKAGFNDENITKQHLFLINQDADLSAKKGGLDMYYKLKGKYAAEKIDVRGLLAEFDELPNDDLTQTASKPPDKK